MKFHLLFAPLVALFLLLNALGGIASGIWLAVIGEWWAVGLGLLGLFSHFLLGLLMMPGMLLGAPAFLLQEKGRYGLATFLAGLSSLYTSALVASWAVAVLLLFLTRATAHSFVPLLIWSYGVATGPWAFFASKDQQAGGNEYSAMSVFFLQTGYVVAAILLLTGASLGTAALCILSAMALSWLAMMLVLQLQMRAEKRRTEGVVP